MRPLRLLALATGATYLVWRAAFTWEGAQPVLFFLLLGDQHPGSNEQNHGGQQGRGAFSETG